MPELTPKAGPSLVTQQVQGPANLSSSPPLVIIDSNDGAETGSLRAPEVRPCLTLNCL